MVLRKVGGNIKNKLKTGILQMIEKIVAKASFIIFGTWLVRKYVVRDNYKKNNNSNLSKLMILNERVNQYNIKIIILYLLSMAHLR